MHHPKQLVTCSYTYMLPDEKIARFPLSNRDQSKLLVYKKGVVEEDIYQNISRHIPAGSLLVFNNTKVIRARLLFQKPSGGVIEVFLLEPEHKEGMLPCRKRAREPSAGNAWLAEQANGSGAR